MSCSELFRYADFARISGQVKSKNSTCTDLVVVGGEEGKEAWRRFSDNSDHDYDLFSVNLLRGCSVQRVGPEYRNLRRMAGHVRVRRDTRLVILLMYGDDLCSI